MSAVDPVVRNYNGELWDAPLAKGTRVLATVNPKAFFTEAAKPDRIGGIGTVIAYHNSHGLCYEVKHDSGVVGAYDPDELTAAPSGWALPEETPEARKSRLAAKNAAWVAANPHGEIRENEHGLDEVLAGNVAFFHLERMSEGSWWMELRFADGETITVGLSSKVLKRTGKEAGVHGTAERNI